jgi:hypothetical protein
MRLDHIYIFESFLALTEKKLILALLEYYANNNINVIYFFMV